MLVTHVHCRLFLDGDEFANKTESLTFNLLGSDIRRMEVAKLTRSFANKMTERVAMGNLLVSSLFDNAQVMSRVVLEGYVFAVILLSKAHQPFDCLVSRDHNA